MRPLNTMFLLRQSKVDSTQTLPDGSINVDLFGDTEVFDKRIRFFGELIPLKLSEKISFQSAGYSNISHELRFKTMHVGMTLADRVEFLDDIYEVLTPVESVGLNHSEHKTYVRLLDQEFVV